ncbi:MAG: hypothetical protein IJ189_12340 [Clostridia bacterium]|nr:hypothetical protein [Clostridia bacterium]
MVQQNAGHSSAAFTLDRYAHVTTTMQKESASRMEKFIASLKWLYNKSWGKGKKGRQMIRKLVKCN